MDLKVYVLLWWYWDGDGHLSHSYEGIYGHSKQAIEATQMKKDEWKLEYIPNIYDDEGLLGASIPTQKPQEQDGYYKSQGFWEIVPERIAVYCEVL